MSEKLIIAIDGPAGSGKSTTAKLLAKKLGYLYIDTGAMYRAVTLYAIKNNILNDEKKIIELASDLDIELKFEDGQTKVRVNGKDVTDEIRSLEVNQNVSPVSKIEGVRKILVQKQKEMGKNGGVVMEGRDITTVVFPNADVKIFLTASIDERARRRALEFAQKGQQVDIEKVKQNILERDRIDSSRDVSPLTKSPDAIEIDTSNLSIDQQVDLILEESKKVADKKGIKLTIN
ncbi:Cytidylate kinase [Ignavibacterium album JCM 16511]|uniref:Cytidylate kinase n=1 Tax=Ignavibacterium album (strain DSM 19864 / JCM 16511 / NBRC 101810 / Mat9-16) TaxID=945713 RepID=I0AIG6_IGNAJ|nr:(d)CMP kinase [Ignavibacterium album]AFH48773.1 Cytidylate kinase [Ignavibacterium album JCM 16511]